MARVGVTARVGELWPGEVVQVWTDAHTEATGFQAVSSTNMASCTTTMMPESLVEIEVFPYLVAFLNMLTGL